MVPGTREKFIGIEMVIKRGMGMKALSLWTMMLGMMGILETIMITMVMEKLLNQAQGKGTDVEIGVSMNLV